MSEPWQALALSPAEAALLAAIIFVAGLVRGFSGFALSALVMAAAATVVPPVSLIPVLWFQEMAASLMMARGGWREANRTVALLLVLGNWIGWPVGLMLTTSLPLAQSTLVALFLILVLALLQLGKLRIPGLASRAGTMVSGFFAGIAAGLAHVGGLVVALYVLAQDNSARQMRGTLVVYLFVASFGALIYLLWFGVMTQAAAIRGLAFVPVTLLSVWLGTKLFNPRWEPFYRPFCLGLLIFLAGVGLLRMALT